MQSFWLQHLMWNLDVLWKITMENFSTFTVANVIGRLKKRHTPIHKGCGPHSTRGQWNPGPSVFRVISQKGADLINIAAEAWNQSSWVLFVDTWSGNWPSQALYLDNVPQTHTLSGTRTYNYSVLNSWQQYTPYIARPLWSTMNTLRSTLLKNSVHTSQRT
jgi:hypothetical protein